jgi:hypothetical protein
MNASPFRSGGAAFHLSAAHGDILAIRLTVTNRMVGPAVIVPLIDDWIGGEGDVHRLPFRTAPDYCYLQQGAEAGLTLTAIIPETLDPGKEYRSDLRFPGIDEEVMPLRLTIEPSRREDPEDRIMEHRIALALPLAGYARDSGATGNHHREKIIYSLMAGLAGMEVIPARWFAAEMLISLCECGLAVSGRPEGGQLLYKLKRTRFFKNGCLVFRGAQIANWAMVSCTISSGLQSAFGKARNEPRMLGTWEQWLLDLAETDIERNETSSSGASSSRIPTGELLEKLGTDSEQWFTTFVLGLYSISGRVRALVDSLCARISDAPPPPRTPAGKRRRRKGADVLSERGSLQR